MHRGLDDALLLQRSLRCLGFLLPNWPVQVFHVTSSLTAEDLSHIQKELISKFADIFNSEHLKPMHGPAMNIVLQPDTQPYHIHGMCAIPFAFREQIKAQLDDMLNKGIIEMVSEPSTWCQAIVLVNKKGTTEK